MRLYEGQIVNRGMDRRFRKRTESRDAIVWDFDDTNKIVRCKIQGSNEYILCHYPRNWQTLPSWCKRGNAVRIAHKGGVRGYMEVIGHGRAVPTPVSGDQFPTAQALYNGILTGGAVNPYGGMSIKIGPTTFRIDGTTYNNLIDTTNVVEYVSLDAILENQGLRATGLDAILELQGLRSTGLDAELLPDKSEQVGLDAEIQTPDITNNTGLDAFLQTDSVSVTLDTAPSSPEFRYDVIIIGTDNVIEVVKGTASTLATVPATPADHVKLAHVLVLGDMTEITDGEINSLWEPRAISPNVEWVPSNGTGVINVSEQFVFHVSIDYPTCQLTVTFPDQYGWDYSRNYTLTFSMLTGSGGILQNDGTYSQDSVEKKIIGGTSYTLYYQRNQLLGVAEQSPIIDVTIDGDFVSSVYKLVLLDSSGFPL